MSVQETNTEQWARHILAWEDDADRDLAFDFSLIDLDKLQEFARDFQAHHHALRNCFLMAMRERYKAGKRGTATEVWDHILRFCAEAGIEPTLTRSAA